MKKVFFSIVIILATLLSNVYGQVDEIKDKARKDKNNNRSNSGDDYYYYDDSESIGGDMCGCIGDIIFSLIWEGIESIQIAALEQKDVYPYVSSFETKVWGGSSPNKNAVFVSPGLQGNWGIISTDFRYTYMEEISGTLNNLDWQIFKLNVPVKTFKASVGIGFTYLTDPGISYLECSFGSELHLLRNRLIISGELRGTGVSEDNETFRKEYSFQVDYLVNSFGRFHLSPMAGFRYQQYYESFNYMIFNAGVALRFY